MVVNAMSPNSAIVQDRAVYIELSADKMPAVQPYRKAYYNITHAVRRL